MLEWLKRQPNIGQVLWIWFMLEAAKVIINGDLLPAFWRGLSGN